MRATPKFQEEYSAKLPAMTLLAQLGWQFMAPSEAVTNRNGQLNQVVLKDILRSELKKRTFNANGESHFISEKSINRILDEVCHPALNEGLLSANERLYNHMLWGISVTEYIDGKKVSPTIALIDWQDIDNNSFVFTEEYQVMTAKGYDHRRPDIVCFVNGIPWVVIEAKRPDGQGSKGPTIKEGISQMLRNQRSDEIPQLFSYSQLLLSINGVEGRYGTCETPMKFWSAWREEEISDEAMFQIKNQVIEKNVINHLFNHRKLEERKWYDQLIAGDDLAVTKQDKLMISLLKPDRLLEMVRLYTLFDHKVGKLVARYQQVFGIKRLVERIAGKDNQNATQRKGGVIWHTTGSGKSLTMVLFSRALILHEALKKCRLVVITDRVDLEDQLSTTFRTSGELATKKDIKDAKATSGRRLAEQIGKGTERIIFSLIQKFNSATKLPECHNDSKDIIVLIDEGHRSQGGENHERMRLALPNAAFVAFTGTPLLKDDKTTNKFGPIVHAYTMQRAVEDKTVTPLLYEERIPDLDVNERAIDSWFDRITLGLTEEQQADLKRKYSNKGQVYQADDRVRLIALDIANHFIKFIDEGLKGQLACDSKAAAVKYKKYLDETGLFESAVVMSTPDSREGNTSVDEADSDDVVLWWKNNVGTQDEKDYTKAIVKRFEQDDKLKMLIVVDKLLTGFDEPQNAVLYIDKPLKEHNLIQAIARVNRLHEKKQFGYLIDYRGILKELDTTIEKYQDLATRTQNGYDIDDLDGLYQQMSTEYKRLPKLYKDLWAVFASVKNKSDTEQLRQILIPKMRERNGELVDVNIKTRDDFYDALTAFSRCLKVALQSASFYQDSSFSENDREHYKETVKQLSNLRRSIKQATGDSIDYDEYDQEVKKLLDKHVVGVEVRGAEGLYEVGKIGSNENPEEWSKDKTRNETDIIKTRITRKIEQNLNDDPYAQEAFSKLLRDAIKAAEELFDHPMKQYMLFKEFEDMVDKRKLDEIPDVFESNRHAQAFYGVFKSTLPSVFEIMDQQLQDKWVKLAFKTDELVNKAVSENSINPLNIESEIRKQLLPIYFAECKAIGKGIDQAKNMVELVVQITRLGLQNS